MKAENILIQIWEKKHNFLWLILQKLDFQNFGLYFVKEKKNFELKIFKNIFIQPPKLMFFNCFKHQKWYLHKGLTILTPSKTKRQASKVSMGWFNPLPVFLGLIIKSVAT